MNLNKTSSDSKEYYSISKEEKGNVQLETTRTNIESKSKKIKRSYWKKNPTLKNRSAELKTEFLEDVSKPLGQEKLEKGKFAEQQMTKISIFEVLMKKRLDLNKGSYMKINVDQSNFFFCSSSFKEFQKSVRSKAFKYLSKHTL